VRWLALVIVAACSAPAPPAPSPLVPATVPATPPPSEPDGDGDKIADADDRCPNDAEVYNDVDDDDGCPDRDCVLVKQYPLCIDERVYFTQNSTHVAPDAAPILDGIAQMLQAGRGDIQRVAVRGFRAGKEAFTLPLQRAAVVRDELVRRGLAAEMLELVDGGVASPTQSPRVEVEITKQRVAYEDADEIACTGAGRWFVKLTTAEKKARCAAQRSN
jgi:outer membrane protein OmpA-like peptidoglycan-associated protein